MSEREELLARLQELENETEPEEQSILAPGKSQKKPSPFDPLPGGWKPEPYIQPENDPRTDPRRFKPGDFYYRSNWTDARLERQALPHPRWPRPGQVATDEEQRAHGEDCNLWMRSSMALEDCIHRWLVRSVDPEHWSDPKRSQLDQAFDRDWRWLTVLWNGRAYPVPTEDQLTEWAHEERHYAEMQDRYPYQIPDPEEQKK